MRKPSTLLFAAISSVCMLLAVAQQPDSPPPEELEPAVDTSAQSRAAAAESSAADPGTPDAAPEQGAPIESETAPQATEPISPEPARAGPRAVDRLELDTTQITGNRELPKVLYIVPWKRSDLGDLVGKPVNSLLDEVLTPVDRDVFRRENRYYRALQADESGGATAPPEAQSAGPER